MRKQKQNLAIDVLSYLSIAGVFLIAATSPYFLINITRAVLRNKNFKNKTDEKKLYRTIQWLKMKDFVYLGKEVDGRFVMKLTEKGRAKVDRIYCDKLKIKKPGKWDKKWRVVIFDIPDKHRKKQRDALRERLKNFDFYQLQKSVWIHPYPCEKEIGLLCDFFDIKEFVDFLVVESTSKDKELRNYFRV